ncbi:hypothetical protein [Candidatus Rariloculus sp.]|uniref:hypothetical protein n=1 Tax=Candidatus Rariloculus sp. TaxID=3101265 RepID=UPI003D14E693
MRAARRPGILSGLFAVCAVCAACTIQTPRPAAEATPRPTDVPTPTAAPAPESKAETAQGPKPASPPTPGQARDLAVEAGVELPEGQGREILVSACLSCHDLGGLALFSGFYTRDNWRTLVLTMIETGATVDAAEIEVVADYLAQHFGPDLP